MKTTEDNKMAPRSKAELMRESRQRRKDAGLVRFAVDVTPAERDALKKHLEKIRNKKTG